MQEKKLLVLLFRVLTTKPLEDREFQFVFFHSNTVYEEPKWFDIAVFELNRTIICYSNCSRPSNELVLHIEQHPNTPFKLTWSKLRW